MVCKAVASEGLGCWEEGLRTYRAVLLIKDGKHCMCIQLLYNSPFHLYELPTDTDEDIDAIEARVCKLETKLKQQK